MSLDRGKCRLMTPDLIDEFDRIWSVTERVHRDLPHLADFGDLVSLVARQARLRTLMERERYLVGFLGRSQVGKSTTLNRVLRPNKARSRPPAAPAPPRPAPPPGSTSRPRRRLRPTPASSTSARSAT